MHFPEDDTLSKLVLKVDVELVGQDVPPHARPLKVCTTIAEQLGISFIFGDAFSSKINAIYHQLYRPTDLELPPMHVGAFMFRDIFFPICIPVIPGEEFGINPVNFLLDTTEFQMQWLFSDKVIGLTFFDQFIDLMDFAYGLDDFEKTSSAERTKELWSLARRQLEAGAAVVLGSFDMYAVIQNCCVAIELLLKGVLVKEGMTDDQLKKLGHKTKDLAMEVTKVLPGIDKKRLLHIADQLPNYVKSRYEVQDYSRRQLGNLVMNAQFIAGEIMRQCSDRDTRLMFTADVGIDSEWDITQRMFPSKSADEG